MQLRRVWSNVGALNLNLWVHTLIEVWSWKQEGSALSNRQDRPWDDPRRRPSHADRRGALRRAMWCEEYQRLGVSRAVVRENPTLLQPHRQISRITNATSGKVQTYTNTV